MQKTLSKSLSASLLMTLCVACGGGGGGSGEVAAVAPPVSAGGSGTTTPPVSSTPPVVTPALSVLAGKPTEAGTVDGSGADVRFNGPSALTIDTAGNLYAGASCAIRKITPAGAVSLYAGTYCAPSTPNTFPTAFTLASAADGRLFMTTYGLNIFEVSAAGTASKYAALEDDGGGRGAAVAYGNGIAVDTAGNLIVTNHLGARKIAPSGSYTMLDGVASVAGNGSGGNTFIAEPRGVAVDAAGTVYLSSAIDGTIVRIDAAGAKTVLAGTPSPSGSGEGARFRKIVALAVDGKGNLYAADSGPASDSNGASTYNALIYKITPAGVVTTIAGTPGVSELKTGPLPGSLAPLGGIALDGKGNLYATSGNAIVKIVLP